MFYKCIYIHICIIGEKIEKINSKFFLTVHFYDLKSFWQLTT
jgi:hypothetical protein